MLALAVVLTVAPLDAQGKLPPLPSADDLAKGNTQTYIAALYADLNNGLGINDEAEIAKIAKDVESWRKSVNAGTGAPAGSDSLDMSALSKMDPKEADAYAAQLLSKPQMGMDMAAMSKMSDKDAEAYAMRQASQMTGLSAAELKKLDKMSDKEAEAFLKNRAMAGTPTQQAYDKEKGAFDKERASARAKTVLEMKKLFERKYSPLVKKAEEDMENCNGDASRFNNAYRRWMTAKDDFRVECFDLWRQRIAKEQETFQKIAKPGRFEGVEAQMTSDALRIALDVLKLPELGIA
jgi:hypothetical protein